MTDERIGALSEPLGWIIVPGLADRMIREAGRVIYRDGSRMWMSNLLIVVNPSNADHNSLTDLTAAVIEAGAEVFAVDEQNCVIEAAVPSEQVTLIAAMGGVTYVRSVFTYLSNRDHVAQAA